MNDKEFDFLHEDSDKEQLEDAKAFLTLLSSEDARRYVYEKLRTEFGIEWLGIKNSMDLLNLVYEEERAKKYRELRMHPITNPEHMFFCPVDIRHHVSLRQPRTPNGIAMYFCKECNKRYPVLQGTLLDGFGCDLYRWYAFIESMFLGLSLEETAKACDLSVPTAQNWRLRIFRAVEYLIKDIKLSGTIEMDETFYPLSYKGKNSIVKYEVPREAYQRGGDTESSYMHQNNVSIVCAIDDSGRCIARLDGIGASNFKRIADSVDKYIDFANTSVLLTDGEYALRKYAAVHQLRHIQLIPRKYKGSKKLPTSKTVDGKKYSIQRINAMHSALKRYLRNHSGVSTKYLQGYLSFFCYRYMFGHNSHNPDAYLGILKTLLRPGLSISDADLADSYPVLVSKTVRENSKLKRFSPIEREIFCRVKNKESIEILSNEFGYEIKAIKKLYEKISSDSNTERLIMMWYSEQKRLLAEETEKKERSTSIMIRDERILAKVNQQIPIEQIALEEGMGAANVRRIIRRAKANGWDDLRPPKGSPERKRKQCKHPKSDAIVERVNELKRENPAMRIGEIYDIVAKERGLTSGLSIAARMSEYRRRYEDGKRQRPRFSHDLWGSLFNELCEIMKDDPTLSQDAACAVLAKKHKIKKHTILGDLYRYVKKNNLKMPTAGVRTRKKKEPED